MDRVASGPLHLRVLRPDDGRQLLHHLRRAMLRQHIGLAQQVRAHDDRHVRAQPPEKGDHVEAGVPDLRRMTVKHAECDGDSRKTGCGETCRSAALAAC